MKWRNEQKLKTFYFLFYVFCLILLSALTVQAAELYLSPKRGDYAVGQSFTATVNISTPDQAMNAAQGTITFPPDKLEVVSLSKSGSILNLWVQEPSFSNKAGTIQFEGVVLNPGFTGSAGKILSIILKGKEIGDAPLEITNGSVLANDGLGTNILTKTSGADYTLTASKKVISPPGLPAKPEVSSETHPQENKWYNNSNLKLSWDFPEGIDKVRVSLNNDSLKSSPELEKEATAQIQYDLTQYQDGIYYFHIRFHNASGWGPIAHRRVQTDRTLPLPFEIKRLDTDDPTNPQPVINFSTIDKTSGIDFYLIQIAQNDWLNADWFKKEDVYILPLLGPDSHDITVRAVDAAGNYIESKTTIQVEPIAAPKITKYSPNVYLDKEALLIEGTAIPDSQIIFSLSKDSEIITFETISDSDGLWQSFYQKKLQSGHWQLSAKTRDNRGALSLPTEGVPVRVDNWFNYVIRIILTHILLIVIIVIIINLIAFGIYFGISRRRYKNTRRKESNEFEEKLNGLKNELKEKINQDIIELKKNLDVLPPGPKVIEIENPQEETQG